MKKADVKLSYHQGTRGLPMVNVKLNFTFDLADVARTNAETFSDPLFPAWLATQDDDDTRSAYESALEDGWRNLQEEAVTIWGGHVKVYSEGRSGGWCVVEGLYPVESWDALALGKWARFAKYAARVTADVPYGMVWTLYNNEFAQHRETIDACVAVHARDAGMGEEIVP